MWDLLVETPPAPEGDGHGDIENPCSFVGRVDEWKVRGAEWCAFHTHTRHRWLSVFSWRFARIALCLMLESKDFFFRFLLLVYSCELFFFLSCSFCCTRRVWRIWIQDSISKVCGGGGGVCCWGSECGTPHRVDRPEPQVEANIHAGEFRPDNHVSNPPPTPETICCFFVWQGRRLVGSGDHVVCEEIVAEVLWGRGRGEEEEEEKSALCGMAADQPPCG